jgi:chromate transport protein ChrA
MNPKIRAEGRMKELALIFLRLGLTAFGGPAAHIAMMEDEFVRKRNLMAAVTWELGKSSVVDASTLIIGLTSALLLLRFRINSAIPIVLGGMVGWLHYAYSNH